MCSTHYAQKLRGKELTPIREFAYKRDPICVIDDCLEKHSALGYCEKHYQIKKNFKIDPLVYEELLKKQNNVCAICGEECAARTRLSIDHDHKTGAIRGLLCMSCNLGIGKFHDDIVKLEKAILYLKEYSYNL